MRPSDALILAAILSPAMDDATLYPAARAQRDQLEAVLIANPGSAERDRAAAHVLARLLELKGPGAVWALPLGSPAIPDPQLSPVPFVLPPNVLATSAAYVAAYIASRDAALLRP